MHRALAADPGLTDALWFQANIELYGLNRPADAITTLARMRERGGLSQGVHDQIDQLLGIARQRQSGGTR